MIDVSDADVHFRGYPLCLMGTECAARLNMHSGYGFTSAAFLDVLANMTDMAGPGEPADRMFRAVIDSVDGVPVDRVGGIAVGSAEVWLERASNDRWGEYWSMYLPEER